MKWRLVASGALAITMVAFVGSLPADTFEEQLGKWKTGGYLGIDEIGTAQVPFLTSGGDVATFIANGGLTTTKDSIYAKAGLRAKLVNGDDFHQQVRDYLWGKSPYLRGTLGMIALANDVLNKDRRAKPVVVFQMTWRAGDHLVARADLKCMKQLKGKKVCLQGSGPHITLLYDTLRAVGLTWGDVTIVWAKNLTGSGSPGELFRADKTIDACCVMSPDMIALCNGGDKGAHVINSTADMPHSIADVYVCRSDYFEEHKDRVRKFFGGYVKAAEQLLEWQKAYNDGKGKSPEYIAALTLAQQIYGARVLPTLESDAHRFVCDTTFVRLPGNELFFDDPNNLTGFLPGTASALDIAQTLGFINDHFGLSKAEWNYNALAEAAGVRYVRPAYATGRVKGE